jgi:hypothetical protein
MSDFRIESSEDRRDRYMRLARAASEAAAKSPLPGAKEMYVKLAQAWIAMAQESDHSRDLSDRNSPTESRPPIPNPSALNVKLNGIP